MRPQRPVGRVLLRLHQAFVVGEPTVEQVEVHGVAQAANESGRAAVEPGVACEDVDRAARKVIEGAGYGEFFIHRKGHVIGLDVHEHRYMVEGTTCLWSRG